VQRRHQKIIEESPAPNVPRPHVEAMANRVAEIMRNMGYDNIGTVEMLMGRDGEFNFLEMNTRLQVEHGVTEEVTGVDLVKAMVRCAAGERLADVLPAEIRVEGHSIQARVYAEDPRNFFPSPGKLTVFRPPQDKSIRIETGYAEGRDVTPFYDPMIAKVIVKAPTRAGAIDRLVDALQAFDIQGLKHNIPAVVAILNSEAFRNGDVHTGIVPEVLARPKKA
jgi:acetyl-CoA carboxylase biotin carboxylase subunit